VSVNCSRFSDITSRTNSELPMMKTIGYISTLLLVACGLPELYVGVKTGIIGSSFGLLYMWGGGCFLGIIYSASLKSVPYVLNNLINTIIVGLLIAMKMGSI